MNTAKRALITGGSAGLGATFARRLRDNGYDVVSLDRDPPQAQGSTPFKHIQCDLSDRARLDAALEDITAGPPFDLVILNAGISATGRFEKISIADHLAVLRINTEAPMVIAARLLQAQALVPGSAMVMVSSLSHFTGYPGAASYAASKDALAVFAKGMRKAAMDAGASITVAFPGPLRTDHAERHAPQGSDASKRMDPELAADLIIKDALAGRKTSIPGVPNRLFAHLGRLFPKSITALMRRIIYERLVR